MASTVWGATYGSGLVIGTALTISNNHREKTLRDRKIPLTQMSLVCPKKFKKVGLIFVARNTANDISWALGERENSIPAVVMLVFVAQGLYREGAQKNKFQNLLRGFIRH